MKKHQLPAGVYSLSFHSLKLLDYSFFSYLFIQIRANHLSGDCHYKRELLRGSMKIRGHEQVSFFITPQPDSHLALFYLE